MAANKIQYYNMYIQQILIYTDNSTTQLNSQHKLYTSSQGLIDCSHLHPIILTNTKLHDKHTSHQFIGITLQLILCEITHEVLLIEPISLVVRVPFFGNNYKLFLLFDKSDVNTFMNDWLLSDDTFTYLNIPVTFSTRETSTAWQYSLFQYVN